MLLGDGVQHLIPLQNGQFFELCNDLGIDRPRITASLGGNAVTLADDNVVRGLIIDGSAGGMANGIVGDGVNNGVIEDVAINDAILNGIFLNNFTGDWEFNRNAISTSGFDGILLTNNTDPTSELTFEANDISDNGRDGISLVNYDAARIIYENNITDGNGRDGVRMVNFLNTTGDGAVVRFFDHIARDNQENGIHVNGGDGDLRFLNSLITGNLANGIRIQNWTNTDPEHVTLISSFDGGTSTINGNGIGSGAGIFNLLEAGTQRLLIRDNTINGNGTGIIASADNVATLLETEILNNVVAANNSDGIRLDSFGGASHFALIEDTNVNGNGVIGGSGIRLVAGDPSATTSLLDVTLLNSTVNNTVSGAGIVGDVIDDAQLNLLVDNSTISGNAGDGIVLDIDTIANLAINSITVNSSTLANNAGGALTVFTGTDTFTDVVVRNSLLNGGGANGISILADGDNGVLGIDNRTRLFAQGNLITNFVGSGIGASATGDASLFVTIDGNEITDNGDTGGLPFFHGISLAASDDALLNGRITNNLVTDNFERGLLVNTTDNAATALLLASNNFSGNDLGEDPTNDPIVDSGIQDLLIVNDATSTTCIAMTNNFFTLDAGFVNAGGLTDFRLELDGVTNSFGGGASFIGPISFPAFGAFCEPAINAEDAAFQADGFPPQ